MTKEKPLSEKEEVCNVCGFIEKDHVNSVHAFIKITKEAKTPNYPKEIEAKMTKEKPLSEIMKKRIFCLYCRVSKKFCNCKGIEIKHCFWSDVITGDVALAVKRLKDDLHLNISTSPLMDTIIDEIFGEFK